MVNPSKQKGTRAETAVVNYLHQNGHPDAHRIALKGTADEGDIAVTNNINLEIKSGVGAETAPTGLIREWLIDCQREAVYAQKPYCFLVTKRRGRSHPSAWRVWIPFPMFLRITTNDPGPATLKEEIVQLTCDALLALIDQYIHPDNQIGEPK